MLRGSKKSLGWDTFQCLSLGVLYKYSHFEIILYFVFSTIKWTSISIFSTFNNLSPMSFQLLILPLKAVSRSPWLTRWFRLPPLFLSSRQPRNFLSKSPAISSMCAKLIEHNWASSQRSPMPFPFHYYWRLPQPYNSFLLWKEYPKGF